MPGSLNHSPADIIRYLLIQNNIGTILTTGNWPIFAHNEADVPDNCITIYDTANKKTGRVMTDGEIQEFHGIQVRIRSNLSTVGFVKANEIMIYLDQTLYRESVTISGTSYCVQSFSRSSGIKPLGKDTPTPTKRNIHTIDGLAMLRLAC